MANPHRRRKDSAATHSHRDERLEEILREELAFLLDSEVGDLALDKVTIRRVTLSQRGARANVWFAAPGKDLNRVQTALARARSFLRFRIAEAIALKRTPELWFFPDYSHPPATTEGDLTS